MRETWVEEAVEAKSSPVLEIVRDIQATNRTLKWVHEIRNGRTLTEAEETVRQQLNERKNKKIFELLEARSKYGLEAVFPVELTMGKREVLHFASMNPFRIYMPSLYSFDQDYYVDLELSDIKDADPQKHSLDALAIIGEHSIVEQDPVPYIKRTAMELQKLDRLRGKARHSEQPSIGKVFRYIDKLTAEIIVTRFIPMIKAGEKPPGVDIEFANFQDSSGNIKYEGVNVKFGSEYFAEVSLGGRLKTPLAEIGGYTRTLQANPFALQEFRKGSLNGDFSDQLVQDNSKGNHNI